MAEQPSPPDPRLLMTATSHPPLRQILLDYFDQEDLITLGIDLGVDYASLPGAGTAN
jgi:hypothetical protein